MKHKAVIAILLTALSLFIALTVLVVAEHGAVQALNAALYAPVAGFITPALTSIAIWIGSLTHWYAYAAVIAILLILPRARMKIGLPVAVTLIVSAITGPVILKNIFAIERPDINPLIEQGGFGYPSGHSMNAMVFFGMCIIMMLRYCKNKPLKIGFTVLAGTSILLVGLSRIYLGVHTVSDVTGGYLAGTVVICIAVLAESRFMRSKKSR